MSPREALLSSVALFYGAAAYGLLLVAGLLLLLLRRGLRKNVDPAALTQSVRADDARVAAPD